MTWPVVRADPDFLDAAAAFGKSPKHPRLRWRSDVWDAGATLHIPLRRSLGGSHKRGYVGTLVTSRFDERSCRTVPVWVVCLSLDTVNHLLGPPIRTGGWVETAWAAPGDFLEWFQVVLALNGEDKGAAAAIADYAAEQTDVPDVAEIVYRTLSTRRRSW